MLDFVGLFLRHMIALVFDRVATLCHLWSWLTCGWDASSTPPSADRSVTRLSIMVRVNAAVGDTRSLLSLA